MSERCDDLTCTCREHMRCEVCDERMPQDDLLDVFDCALGEVWACRSCAAPRVLASVVLALEEVLLP